MELTSHHQSEEFGKGQQEMPCALPPLRTPLIDIDLGRAMCAPPGRTSCPNDWPKTTQKLIPSP